MKKNTRIRRRKYNSRKKYIFPLACLSILLVVSVAGVFANTAPTFEKDGLKYEVIKEPDGDNNGTVKIVGATSGDVSKLVIPATAKGSTASSGDAEVEYDVVSIGAGAFSGNKSLSTIDFSKANNLYKIEAKAFKGCTALTEIDIKDSPAELTHIFKEAFMGCTGLTTVSLPDEIQLISQSAFEDCTNLSKVVLDSTEALETIGSRAFYNCANLTSFPDLSESKLDIADGAFEGCAYLNARLLPDESSLGTNLVQSLTLDLRGLSAYKLTPVGITSSETEPKNMFKGQEYTITFTPLAGHSMKGLDFLTSIDAIPEKYEIDDKEFTGAGDTYTFTMPASENIILFAAATRNNADNGAPTITTTALDDGTKGQPYKFTLDATNNVTNWSATGLPSGFALNSATGVISCNTITANKGTYPISITAANNVSTHEKKLTLKIFDNKLSDFGRNDLWWEESGDKVSIAWEPLTAGSGETIDYTIKIYNDRNQEVGSFEKTLTGAYTSSFANEDVTDILAAAGKGTYYFTITAESNTYGSSFASSKNSAKGTYPYGYEKYTITATVSGSGTGKVSLSNASYNIPGIDANPLTNGVKVTVLENSITETTPLTFLFTPDKGCEVTKLTVNGNAITKNMESYTIKSIDEIPAANTSGSTGSNSSGNSGTSGGTSGSDSGVLVASERSTTLNASGTNSGSLDILAEFGLVSNNIDGNIILDGSYVQGEKASFEAYGDGMNDVPVVDGVTRWVPKYWWLDDEKKAEGTTTHSWTSDPYSDAIDTTNLSLGTHTLYVAFQKQNYVGSTGQWVDAPTVNSTDIRAADFVVTDKTGNTEDPDKESDKDSSTKGDKDSNKNTNSDKKDNTSKDKNTGKGSSSGSGTGSVVDRVTSTLSNVATGDDMTMALWIALALVSLIGIGFCVRQIIKH